MGLSTFETIVQWNATDSIDLIQAGAWTAKSEPMVQRTNAREVTMQLKADKSTGTPVAGNLVRVQVLSTSGKSDGPGADEYDTPGHALELFEMDLFTETPAQRNVRFPNPIKGYQIYVKGDGFTGTDVITFSCSTYEQVVD